MGSELTGRRRSEQYCEMARSPPTARLRSSSQAPEVSFEGARNHAATVRQAEESDVFRAIRIAGSWRQDAGEGRAKIHRRIRSRCRCASHAKEGFPCSDVAQYSGQGPAASEQQRFDRRLKLNKGGDCVDRDDSRRVGADEPQNIVPIDKTPQSLVKSYTARSMHDLIEIDEIAAL